MKQRDAVWFLIGVALTALLVIISQLGSMGVGC